MERPASDKYNLNISPGRYHFFGFGEIDCSNLTLKQADALFASGFPHLVLKPKVEKSAAPKVKKITKRTS